MAAAPRPKSSAASIFRDDLLDVIPFPIYVADTGNHEIVSVNKAMQIKTGAKVGEPCHWAIYRQESPCFFCKIGELIAAQGGDTPPAIMFEHFNDRDECWYQIHETLLTLLDGRLAKHSIAVDIALLKDAQNELSEAYALLALKSLELERVSVTDSLTGLFNRRRLDQAFDYELGRAFRYDIPVSVIIADIDRFKSINDTHGHQIGDQVLQLVADIMRHGVRTVDTIGRWGGEEFLIICPETDLEGARALAEKLRAVIEATAFPAAIHNTTSFGVAEARAGETMKDLVARADAALYRAKTSGRNRVET
jgi:diguanylate cyclase (GGDEF)-like protein